MAVNAALGRVSAVGSDHIRTATLRAGVILVAEGRRGTASGISQRGSMHVVAWTAIQGAGNGATHRCMDLHRIRRTSHDDCWARV